MDGVSGGSKCDAFADDLYSAGGGGEPARGTERSCTGIRGGQTAMVGTFGKKEGLK